MGSFDGTCAVSRLAIKAGDEVFWLYCEKDYVKTTYDLMSGISHSIRTEMQRKAQEKKDEEFRASYPDVEFEGLAHIFDSTPDCFWGFGKYDDYGGVEDVAVPEGSLDSLILIRKSVADKMAKFGATLMDREWSTQDTTLFKESYPYCVVLLSWLTRINLFGCTLLGRQSADLDEFKEYHAVQRFIKEEARAMFYEVYRDSLEYENWSFWVGVKSKFSRLILRILGRKKDV